MRDSDSRSDMELISLCNSGSRSEASAAFSSLYARHKDYVLRVAFRYVGNADLALDVLQETFSYLLRKFPPPGAGLVLTAQLRTLLYSAAKSTALSILRNKNVTTRDENIEPDELRSPEDGQSELPQLLSGLAPNEREVIILRFVDDLSLAEIAETLEIPLGTAKSRLHKAVMALRNSRYIQEFFDK